MLQGHPVRLNRNPDPLFGLAPEFCTIETLFGQVKVLLVVLFIIVNLHINGLCLKVCRYGQRLLASLLLFFQAKAAGKQIHKHHDNNDHQDNHDDILRDLFAVKHIGKRPRYEISQVYMRYARILP